MKDLFTIADIATLMEKMGEMGISNKRDQNFVLQCGRKSITVANQTTVGAIIQAVGLSRKTGMEVSLLEGGSSGTRKVFHVNGSGLFLAGKKIA